MAKRKIEKEIEKKVGLVFSAMLSRITDFQLHSNDDDFFNIVEDLREEIINLEKEFLCKRKNAKETIVEKSCQ